MSMNYAPLISMYIEKCERCKGRGWSRLRPLMWLVTKLFYRRESYLKMMSCRYCKGTGVNTSPAHHLYSLLRGSGL